MHFALFNRIGTPMSHDPATQKHEAMMTAIDKAADKLAAAITAGFARLVEAASPPAPVTTELPADTGFETPEPAAEVPQAFEPAPIAPPRTQLAPVPPPQAAPTNT